MSIANVLRLSQVNTANIQHVVWRAAGSRTCGYGTSTRAERRIIDQVRCLHARFIRRVSRLLHKITRLAVWARPVTFPCVRFGRVLGRAFVPRKTGHKTYTFYIITTAVLLLQPTNSRIYNYTHDRGMEFSFIYDGKIKRAASTNMFGDRTSPWARRLTVRTRTTRFQTLRMWRRTLHAYYIVPSGRRRGVFDTILFTYCVTTAGRAATVRTLYCTL